MHARMGLNKHLGMFDTGESAIVNANSLVCSLQLLFLQSMIAMFIRTELIISSFLSLKKLMYKLQVKMGMWSCARHL